MHEVFHFASSQPGQAQGRGGASARGGERHRAARRRHEKKRWFLHENHWSARSWKDPEVQSVASLPGVDVVRGDMCSWGLNARSETGDLEPVMKGTGWMTNNRRLAELLGRRCK
eukprot:7413061-Pyramimonas_sp.AAC.1